MILLYRRNTLKTLSCFWGPLLFSGHIDLPTNSIMMDGDNIIRRFVNDREWPREEILSAVDVWGIRYFYEDATGDPEEWLAGRCN